MVPVEHEGAVLTPERALMHQTGHRSVNTGRRYICTAMSSAKMLPGWIRFYRNVDKARFAVGATNEIRVSEVEGRTFMRRFGGRPFDTSGGRSR
jgi:hypothetical protein